jgi:hypothetical protein
MELLIVVAGVLIALSAQQWAEEQSAKKRAAAADARIRAELRSNLLLGVERIALRECVERRLAMLAIGLSGGKSDWTDLRMVRSAETPMVFRRMYRIPDRNWRTTEYQGSLTTGGQDSVSPERSGLIAAMYGQVRSQQSYNEEELRLASELGSLQFQQPVVGSDRIRLLAILVRLDLLNSTMVLMAEQQIQSFRELKYLNSSEEELAQAREAKYWSNMVASMRGKYGSCVDGGAISAFDRRMLQ